MKKETMTKKEVIEMLKEMQIESAKCKGFIAGTVTQSWVIGELIGKRIALLGGEPHKIVGNRLIVE